MKTLYKLFFLIMATTLITGCNKDEESVPKITIATSEFTIGIEQGNQAKATFSTNVSWTTSISYEGDTKDWLIVTPESGDAGDNMEITMSATVNPAEIERKAYVTINYGGKNHKITVTQSKFEDNITKYFDAKFATKLQQRGYIPDAKKILLSDVINITYLEIAYNPYDLESLTSLAGIEYFESLTQLKCRSNQLTSLDVSKNTKLTSLHCSYNQLTSLDVSKNTRLDLLDCSRNQLTSLDVSKNVALGTLYCYYNQLTSLDVSKNVALGALYCYYNQLTSLDVSKNVALGALYCYYNQLTSIEVNTELTELNCSHNLFTSLDVSKSTKLTELVCDYNQLTSLNVSKSIALGTLFCSYNQLTSLDVSKNIALGTLLCYNNQLTSLNVSKNIALGMLQCYNNQLTSLNISNNTAITIFSCHYNPGNGTSFVIKAWFGNNNIPPLGSIFTKGNWDYEGRTITIDYQKVN